MNSNYNVRQELRPRHLQGISEEQIAEHWSLYEGYVKNLNPLIERLNFLAKKKEFGSEFSNLKRRVGFEINGVVLHEHYFGILKAGQSPLGSFAELTKMFKKFYGGFDAWKEEFRAMGKMRGVGWVILYLDPDRKILQNHWIDLHEAGHPAGFTPLLVMDVWEHAYMVDHGVDGRASCVEGFLRNVDWPAVEHALKSALRPAEIEAHLAR